MYYVCTSMLKVLYIYCLNIGNERLEHLFLLNHIFNHVHEELFHSSKHNQKRYIYTINFEHVSEHFCFVNGLFPSFSLTDMHSCTLCMMIWIWGFFHHRQSHFFPMYEPSYWVECVFFSFHGSFINSCNGSNNHTDNDEW